MIKVSIITVNYNNLNGLKKTVSSVKNQSWREYEHIIIDGGSIDGGKEFIAQNDYLFAYSSSEPDTGVYNAMNKGIRVAAGEYILFLNSGDEFVNANSLGKVHRELDGTGIIYCDLKVIDKDGHFIKQYPEVLSFSYFVRDTLPHPATFINRKLFYQVGFYDESLTIVADWKFFIDAICKYNVKYKYINKTISCFYLGGLSSKPGSEKIILNEKRFVINSEYKIFLNDIAKTLYYERLVEELKKSRIIKALIKLGFLNKIKTYGK